jgi:hypothetical protein
MLPPSELDKSLQELEQSDWGEPTYDSHLVTTVHRLRRVALREFSVEDLRIMIGQSIGLPYLVPLALQHLRKDPLAEGDFYPGDLLKGCSQSTQRFGASTRSGGMKSERLPAAHSHAYTR